MQLSPGGDEYIYTGSANLIDSFRAQEVEILSLTNKNDELKQFLHDHYNNKSEHG